MVDGNPTCDRVRARQVDNVGSQRLLAAAARSGVHDTCLDTAGYSLGAGQLDRAGRHPRDRRQRPAAVFPRRPPAPPGHDPLAYAEERSLDLIPRLREPLAEHDARVAAA